MITASTIHGLIERHAASRGESIALVDGDRTLTYRELNQRANATARCLVARGFRRGSLAVVKMERSVDLAVVLLAVLKAGGAYTWFDVDADTTWPAGLSFVLNESGGEERCIAIDVTQGTSAPSPPSPNLPILTRPGDAACVLRNHHGAPAVLVPHAAIAALALQPRPVPDSARQTCEPTALDLWLALMAGCTAVLTTDRAESAAA